MVRCCDSQRRALRQRCRPPGQLTPLCRPAHAPAHHSLPLVLLSPLPFALAAPPSRPPPEARCPAVCRARGRPASAAVSGTSTPRQPLLSCRASSTDSQRQALRPACAPTLPASSQPRRSLTLWRLVRSAPLPVLPRHPRRSTPQAPRLSPLPEPFDPFLPALPRRSSPVATPPQDSRRNGGSLRLGKAQPTCVQGPARSP